MTESPSHGRVKDHDNDRGECHWCQQSERGPASVAPCARRTEAISINDQLLSRTSLPIGQPEIRKCHFGLVAVPSNPTKDDAAVSFGHQRVGAKYRVRQVFASQTGRWGLFPTYCRPQAEKMAVPRM